MSNNPRTLSCNQFSRRVCLNLMTYGLTVTEEDSRLRYIQKPVDCDDVGDIVRRQTDSAQHENHRHEPSTRHTRCTNTGQCRRQTARHTTQHYWHTTTLLVHPLVSIGLVVVRQCNPEFPHRVHFKIAKSYIGLHWLDCRGTSIYSNYFKCHLKYH